MYFPFGRYLTINKVGGKDGRGCCRVAGAAGLSWPPLQHHLYISPHYLCKKKKYPYTIKIRKKKIKRYGAYSLATMRIRDQILQLYTMQNDKRFAIWKICVGYKRRECLVCNLESTARRATCRRLNAPTKGFALNAKPVSTQETRKQAYIQVHAASTQATAAISACALRHYIINCPVILSW